MDPPDTPNDNFASVQRTCDLDYGLVVSLESGIRDGRWWLEGGGRVTEYPS